MEFYHCKHSEIEVIEPGKENEVFVKLIRLGEAKENFDDIEYKVVLKSSNETKYKKINWSNESNPPELPAEFFDTNKCAEVDEQWFIDNKFFTVKLLANSKEEYEDRIKNENIEKEALKKKWKKQDIIFSSIVNVILEAVIIVAVIIAHVKGGENLRKTMCTIFGAIGAIYGIYIVIKDGYGNFVYFCTAIAGGAIIGLILGGIIVWPLYTPTSRIITLIVGTVIIVVKEILNIRSAKKRY